MRRPNVDHLNIKFLRMKSEKRLANICVMAKRVGELDNDYMEVREAVRIAAPDLNVHELEIRFKEEYPEDFEW